MKIVLYSQRVDIIEKYQERRDAADQRIPQLIQSCGYIPLPIPNVLENIEQLVDIINPAGIMLTGGNSLVIYGGNAPERDNTDLNLIGLAEKKHIPLYGFCRGMQSILTYYGCDLIEVKEHVGILHPLQGEIDNTLVNSYHNQAATDVKKPLKVLAKAPDGIIEAVIHEKEKIIGTMWHPERGESSKHDILRIKKLFR